MLEFVSVVLKLGFCMLLFGENHKNPRHRSLVEGRENLEQFNKIQQVISNSNYQYVPHKAVAEVSRQETYRRGMYGSCE